MSVEKFSKIENYKGIKEKKDSLSDYFIDLKYNKKKPKYNYFSGLVAGMIITHLSALKSLLESKSDKKIINKSFELHILPLAKNLIESYNWKLSDLTNLTKQFFGESDG